VGRDRRQLNLYAVGVGSWHPGRRPTAYRKGSLAFLEGVEQLTAALAQRIQAAVDAHAVQLLHAAAVELEDLVAWGDIPDMAEGNLGELTSPLRGQADTAAEGHEHVAAVLAAVEAFVRVGPHAVDGVGALGLSKDILEGDLQMVIDVVGITVHKINLSHFEMFPFSPSV